MRRIFIAKRLLQTVATVFLTIFACATPVLCNVAEEGHDHIHTGPSKAVTDTTWTCSMHPQIQLPESGQCPICFMDLIEVPKETDTTNRISLRQISFDERARRLAQVEVSPVMRGEAVVATRMVGKIAYDEARLSTITSWIGGRIDKLHVDYTGAVVINGQAIAEIYSPELYSSQAELIQAVAAVKNCSPTTLDIIRQAAVNTEKAAREKLRLQGLTDAQIETIVHRGIPADHITITAPMGGIVVKKDVFEGMYVKTGATLYSIADLDFLWVNLEVYETDLKWIELDQQVEFTVQALPGQVFTGTVAYVDPVVDERTRTIRVRLNVDNTHGKLKPGMFVKAQVKTTSQKGEKDTPLLLVPASAPLFTGKRSLVYVQHPKKTGVYEGKEVLLGPRSGEYYQVKSGLKEGERVVTKGNFKIDSAIQIQARPSMMNQFSAQQSESKDIDPLFLSKLSFLNKSFSSLSHAVHAKDKKRLEKNLTAFQAKLEAIDPFFLPPKDQLVWKDMSMLLGNDIILASEAENHREMELILVEMSDHFYKLRNYFQLPEQVTKASVSPELQESLGSLLNTYLRLRRNLAADDLIGSQEQTLKVVKQGQKTLDVFSTENDEMAQEIMLDLARALKTLAQSLDMETIRAAFSPLSLALIDAVERYGASGTGPIYIHYCPMAFNNKGAPWLADDEIIDNPYFGHLMRRCGEVRKQLQE